MGAPKGKTGGELGGPRGQGNCEPSAPTGEAGGELGAPTGEAGGELGSAPAAKPSASAESRGRRLGFGEADIIARFLRASRGNVLCSARSSAAEG